MPENLDDPEVFESLQTYQVHAHSIELAGKNNENECHSSYGQYFTENTVVSKPLDSKFKDDEKQGFLKKWRNRY